MRPCTERSRNWHENSCCYGVRMAAFDPYAVPKEVLAYLDWFSGTLFVNETLEAWENLQHGNSDRVALLESVTHEIYHFLQAVVTDGDVAPYGATFEDGYRNAVVADGILESALSGRTVNLQY